MRIFLTGFMGTGKTDVGKDLALKLGFEFIDLDDVIVQKEKISINDIFHDKGEEYFRDIESLCLKEVAGKDNIVVATGGGVVIREENRKVLAENGVVVCLMAKPETIFERLKDDASRPLLAVDNPLQKIKDMVNIREKYYREAEFVVDTDGKDVEEIVFVITRLDRVMTVLCSGNCYEKNKH